MAVRIRFDSTGNVEDSVFVLSTRNGTKLGNVPYYNLTFRGTLTSGCEMSFKVDKTDFALWDQLKDFKLIWARDYDIWLEIYVELDEGSETTKNIIAKSLGEAELSQILVYDLECNTEAETEKEGYWLTSKAGIGNFTFYYPESGQMEESYGVIADTLVGNLILGERVGVYNTEGSITLGKDGLTITTNGADENASQFAFTIQRKEYDEAGDAYTVPIMYVDASGELVLNGLIRINSSADTDVSTLNDLADTSRFNAYINETVHDYTQPIYNVIDEKYNDVRTEVNGNIDAYKAELGQYLQYDENGLTLGATSSEFKTVIDNQRLAFKQGDTVVAYMSNNQLYIPNAVIENTMILGNFFFAPHADGSVSLTWQGN